MALPSRQTSVVLAAALIISGLLSVAPLSAQEQPQQPAGEPASRSYVVGAQDVLTITSYDDPTLTGRFAVETDLTFTYPLIGRVLVGGLTLREVEAALQNQLKDGGFFKNPQILVTIEQYKSQKIFVVGEVNKPGAYSISGQMRLVEALALAGSTLQTAAGEIVVVPAEGKRVHGDSAASVTRVNIRDLQGGDASQNVLLKGGDTVFVLRAESIYVFGQVKAPGAYPLQQNITTVLQGLALAGGVTDRGSTSRVLIVRVVEGTQKKLKVELNETLQPGDTIVVPERFF